jgi:hypothetical protein
MSESRRFPAALFSAARLPGAPAVHAEAKFPNSRLLADSGTADFARRPGDGGGGRACIRL